MYALKEDLAVSRPQRAAKVGQMAQMQHVLLRVQRGACQVAGVVVARWQPRPRHTAEQPLQEGGLLALGAAGRRARLLGEPLVLVLVGVDPRDARQVAPKGPHEQPVVLVPPLQPRVER